MSCDERTTRRQGGDAAMTLIRPLRGGDLREVLAIVRQAFPENSWTLETAKGWLARSPLGARLVMRSGLSSSSGLRGWSRLSISSG